MHVLHMHTYNSYHILNQVQVTVNDTSTQNDEGHYFILGHLQTKKMYQKGQ